MERKENFIRLRQFIKFFVFMAAILFVMTGAKTNVNAAGVSISSPKADSEHEAGKKITVKVEGSSLFSFGNFYYRVTRINPDNTSESILYDKKELSWGEASFVFTPDKVGYYKIEVQASDENNLEDLNPDDTKTIIVWKDISGAEVSGLTDKVYNGQEQTQNVTVTLGEKTLKSDTDYEVSYSDNVNAGTATVTISGKSPFYKGSTNKTFSITGKPIPESAVSSLPDASFTNKQIKPEPEVIDNGITLEKGTDYELSYGQNTNVGTPGTVTIKGIGNYSGEVTKTFNILPVSIRKAFIAAISDRNYTGVEIKPNPSLKYNGFGISQETDYSLTYSDNINPGTATVVFTGIGNFKDSVTRTFTILEPVTSGSGRSVILSPEDNTEYPVGTEITVNAQATVFLSDYYAGSPINMNFIYIKVIRNSEQIHYERTSIRSMSDVVTLKFTADVAGEYLIQTEWDNFHYEVEGTSIHYIPIASEDFSPDNSITVYVGTPAPQGAVRDISNATITGVSDKTYTGNAITQNLTVKDGDKTLTYGTDYYLTYLNNYDVGPAAVQVHGKGNYTGTSEYITFQITKCPLTADMIFLSSDSFTYNGNVQKPNVTVKQGDYILDKDIEYTIENDGGTVPGNYQVTITAKDDSKFTGTVSKAYEIKGISIAGAVVKAEPSSYIYDGTEKKPAVTVTLNGEALPEDSYTVSYKNNINAGTAEAVVTAKAGSIYADSSSGAFTIGACSITSENISVDDIPDVTYNRAAQTPAPTVTFGDKALLAGTDYILTYSSNTNVGTAEVTITGKGNFKDSITKSFAINKKDISDSSVTVEDIPKQLYVEGTPSRPAVTVKDGNDILTEEEYAVEYSNNTAPGKATITISGKGNYTGSRGVTFDILERTEYAEHTLEEKVKELEDEDTTQYLPEDSEELKKAIEEAKKILDDDKSDAEALEKAKEKIEEAKKKAEEKLNSLPTPEAVEKIIMKDKKDNDPKGSDFARLQLRSTNQGKNSISLQWTNISSASKYVVYGGICGKKIKKLDTVTTNKYTCKGLKKGKYYKFIVVAVINTSAGEKAASTSKMIHVVTKGGKNGNDKSVTVKVKSGKKKKAATNITIKKGKKLTLYASTKPVSKKLKVKKHVAIRFESTDTKTATVSKKGVIKAKAKGTCYIYVYAQNGVYKKIKVTVK
ncbi:MAG: hypothetical protein J5517_06010 [Eubacterium sp.]|nr:hypothetical protein [Eubacterium sp.]